MPLTLYKYNGTIIRTVTGDLARAAACCCDAWPPPYGHDCDDGVTCQAWGEWDGTGWVYRADLSDCPPDPDRAGPGDCENTYVILPLFFPPDGTEFVGQLRCFPCLEDVPP